MSVTSASRNAGEIQIAHVPSTLATFLSIDFLLYSFRDPFFQGAPVWPGRYLNRNNDIVAVDGYGDFEVTAEALSELPHAHDGCVHVYGVMDLEEEVMTGFTKVDKAKVEGVHNRRLRDVRIGFFKEVRFFPSCS